MNDLIQLIKVISAQKIKQIQIISESDGNENNYARFYHAIMTGHVKTEEEACALLFPNSENKASFNRFRNRFKNRLYNTLFFIDLNQPNFNDHRKAKFELNKLWCIVQMLYERQLPNEAIQLCKKMLPLSLKFEETHTSLNVSMALVNHYLVAKPNKKKYSNYRKIYNRMEIQLRLEFSCLNLRSDFIQAIREPSKLTESYYNELEKRINKLISNKEYLSELIIKYSYQMLSYIYILRKEYNKSIKACKQAINLFSKKPYVPLKTLLLFREDLFFSYMYLREFKTAEGYILTNLSQVSHEGAYYFRTYNYYSNLAAYSGDFDKLYDLVSEVISNTKLKFFVTYYEKLSIKEAYVHLLILMGKVKEENKTKKLRKFRLNKFLNDVPYYVKDKRGNNIAILIIQMLYLIIDKKYSKAIDRIDALKQYSYRYLRKGDSFRSNCFIKMLIIIPKQDFHPVAVQRHTRDLLARLKMEPMVLSEQSADVEVIPYETLWQFTIEAMGGTLE